MADNFSHSGRHGSYQLQLIDNMIIGTLKGALGMNLAQHYLEDLKRLVHKVKHQPWAYITHTTDYHALTPEAGEYLRQAITFSIGNNCRTDAYCVNSAMGAAQLQQMRQLCGINSQMQEHLFDTLEQAKTFVQNRLLQEAQCKLL